MERMDLMARDKGKHRRLPLDFFGVEEISFAGSLRAKPRWKYSRDESSE